MRGKYCWTKNGGEKVFWKPGEFVLKMAIIGYAHTKGSRVAIIENRVVPPMKRSVKPGELHRAEHGGGYLRWNPAMSWMGIAGNIL